MKSNLENPRPFDIIPLGENFLTIKINGEDVRVAEGETVLTALFSYGQRPICKNDYGIVTGAYCGMGICYSCSVFVNNIKTRACKATVVEGMVVETLVNISDRFEKVDLDDTK